MVSQFGFRGVRLFQVWLERGLVSIGGFGGRRRALSVLDMFFWFFFVFLFFFGSQLGDRLVGDYGYCRERRSYKRMG